MEFTACLCGSIVFIVFLLGMGLQCYKYMASKNERRSRRRKQEREHFSHMNPPMPIENVLFSDDENLLRRRKRWQRNYLF